MVMMPNCESCFWASKTKTARWSSGLKLCAVARVSRIVEIVVVLEDVHGVVRNVDGAVVIVVALLHARRSHADHLKRHTVDADGFADCGHAGEKLVPRFRSDDGIEAMLHVVGIVEKPALFDVKIPYVLHRRVEAHHGKGKRAIVVLNRGIFLQHAGNVAAKRDIVAQQFDVVVGEANLDASLVASRLLGSAAGEYADGGGAETLKNGFDGFPEAVAVGEKQDDGGDAPGHSRHREQGAAQVVAHG
jgi:hypothetical protein